MTALASIAILIIVPLLMIGIQWFKPRFAYQWLVAVFGAVAAVPLMLLARSETPRLIRLVIWQPEQAAASSLSLLLDPVSWTYALILTILILSVILTASTHLDIQDWRVWSTILALGALGLVAVLAANPLTLLLGWTAIDLLEVLSLMLQIYESEVRQKVVAALAARLLGSAVLGWAVFAARSAQEDLLFSSIPPQVSLYLLLAAGLRLGVVPLQIPFLQQPPLRRGLGTALRLVPAAASLVLVNRVAILTIPALWKPFLLLPIALAVLSSSVSWITSRDELAGRVFWILGTSALAIAAAIDGQPLACLAWGTASILIGGLLFLAAARPPRLVWIFMLGVLGFSAVPFSPTWAGSLVYTDYSGAANLLWLTISLEALFFVSHFLLLLGFLGFAIKDADPLPGAERWISLVYPLGLFILPATQIALGWINRPALKGMPVNSLWAGILVVALVMGYWTWRARGPYFEEATHTLRGGMGWGASFWGKLLALDWLYRFLSWLFHALGRPVSWTSRILEGEGGILWAMILFVFIISFLLRSGFIR